jgi:NitT/TauT family transport system permease protein
MTAIIKGESSVSIQQPVRGGREQRRRHRLSVVLTQIGIVVAVFGVWQLLVELDWLNSFFFGSPVLIFTRFARWVADGSLFIHTLVTLYEAAVGFVIAVVFAIPIGLFLARSRFWDRVTRPFIDMANATPRFALAPLFVLIFGLGVTTKVVLVISIVFFIMLINTMAGVKAIEEDYVRLGMVAGATKMQLFGRVIVPATGGYVIAGLRLSVPYALAGAVVGEMLSGSEGLGYLVAHEAGLLDTSGVLAAVLVLAILGWALNALVALAVARTPWAR